MVFLARIAFSLGSVNGFLNTPAHGRSLEGLTDSGVATSVQIERRSK